MGARNGEFAKTWKVPRNISCKNSKQKRETETTAEAETETTAEAGTEAEEQVKQEQKREQRKNNFSISFSIATQEFEILIETHTL